VVHQGAIPIRFEGVGGDANGARVPGADDGRFVAVLDLDFCGLQDMAQQFLNSAF